MSALDDQTHHGLTVPMGSVNSGWTTGEHRPSSVRPAGSVRAEARQARNLTTRVR